jgi:hypothetical protein
MGLALRVHLPVIDIPCRQLQVSLMGYSRSTATNDLR